jgi:hypothetical protein
MGMGDKPDFHAEMDRLQGHLPGWARRLMRNARRPDAVWLRVPLGLVLIGGGIIGTVLPILGFWMVPLGLVLVAVDLPFLHGPLARMLAFINRKLAPEAG